MLKGVGDFPGQPKLFWKGLMLLGINCPNSNVIYFNGFQFEGIYLGELHEVPYASLFPLVSILCGMTTGLQLEDAGLVPASVNLFRALALKSSYVSSRHKKGTNSSHDLGVV